MELWFIIIVFIFPALIGLIIFLEMNKNRGAKVYIFDKYRNITIKNAEVKEGKCVFKYNESTKGGVAIESNEYKFKKKKIFFYDDIDGILLPIKKTNYSDENISLLDLSTSQEKLYETEALRLTAEKINDTWWEKNKVFVFGAFIIMIAFLIFIITMKFATDIEPVSQPSIQLVNSIAQNLQNLSETNQRLAEAIIEGQSNTNSGGVPR